MTLRILIADDDTISRIMLSAYLEALGHLVTETKDGDELVIEANKKRHDLIITDLIMEDMNGDEAAHIIKLNAKNYIILATSSDNNKLPIFDDIICKPFTIRKLSDAIDRFMVLTNPRYSV